MTRSFPLSLAALAICTIGALAADPMVGGAPMYPTKDIIDNAVTYHVVPGKFTAKKLSMESERVAVWPN